MSENSTNTKKGMCAMKILLSIIVVALVGGLSAGDLEISGDYVVSPDGESYGSVSVIGNANITGGPLTLADGGAIVISSGKSATFACTVSLGQNAGDSVSIAPASDATALFTGKITGPADIFISAADKTGTVRFAPASGVTSDFDGNLSVIRGTFRAKGDSALGSTVGTTTCISTKTGDVYDNFIYFEGMETAETLWLSRGDIGWSKVDTILFTGDCTFNGPICAPSQKQEYGWNFKTGITLTFNGGLGSQDKPYGQFMGSEQSTANIVFNSPAFVKTTWYWMNGVNTMNAPLLGDCKLCFRGGKYFLSIANVFAASVAKDMIFEKDITLVFDLVDGEQKFAAFSAKKDNSATCEITSSTGQTLKLTNGSADSVYRGIFSGNVNFDVMGDKTVTLHGKSTTTGTLSLSGEAKVVFAAGASWRGGLSLEKGDGTQSITLDNGGMTVSSLVVGGEKLPDGVYGSDSSPVENKLSFLSGEGLLTVAGIKELVIAGGEYRVDENGGIYSNIRVEGDAEIKGGPLTLADGGTIVVSSGKSATFACTVTLGQSAGDSVSIAPASGATALFTGKITGPADIFVSAADKTGTVRFAPASGVTSDFDGNLSVIRGTFRAKGDSALGSTVGTTTCISTKTGDVYDNFIYFEGMETAETLWLSRGDIGWSKVDTILFTGDCTFNGPICAPSQKQEYGWNFKTGITLTFNGGLGSQDKPYGQFMGSEQSTANIVFNSPAFVKTTWYWMNGVNTMNAPLLGDCKLCFRGGKYLLPVANAFVSANGNSKVLAFGRGDPLVFDLIGGDQLFAGIDGGTHSAATEITSGNGWSLRLDGTGNSVFHGRFTGSAGLSVEAAQCITLSGNNTSAGTLMLTNGAQAVFSGSGDWAGRIVIAGNGGEKLTIAGSLHAAEVVVGGKTLAPGHYGPDAPVEANRLSCIEGNGTVVIAPGASAETAVWDAGGGTSLGVSDAANWSGDRTPDCETGLDSVHFASSGETAQLDRDVFWNAVDFISGVSSFRLFGDGCMTLANGIRVSEPHSSHEIDSPICTLGSQTWTLAEGSTVTLSGKLSGNEDSTVTLSGAGTYVFAGRNGDTGSNFRSVDSAVVHVKSAGALGTAEGVTTIGGSGALVLDNVSINEPFVLAGQHARRGTLVSLKPGTNVLNGKISVKSQVYLQDQKNGGRLVVSSGMDLDMPGNGYNFRIGWFGKSSDKEPFRFEIKDVPIVNTGSKTVLFYNECVCDVIVSVPGNRLTPVDGSNRSRIQMTRNDKNAAGEPTARLICKVPYAFAYTDELILGVNEKLDTPYHGLIDLCGNDQGFAAAYGLDEQYQTHPDADGVPQGAHSIVTSSGGPAYLCSRHAEDVSTWWTFTGAAGYRMEGSGGITFRTSSRSSGALCVTNGTMTLPSGVAWRRASKVVAEENGTFILAGSLGPDTEVYLSGNGKLHLPEGVNARAGCLVLEGSAPRFGEWGSPESGASNTSSHITGKGRIRFGSPLRIMIR